MGKIAFVFPGQGAQYIGMGKSLCDNYEAARRVYHVCRGAGAEDIINISFAGEKEELTQTNIAQPAIFMADLAAALALESQGIKAEGAAGFSLGEIPALSFCGVLGLQEAFKLVCFRAEAMHAATTEQKGGMIAVIGLPPEQIAELCEELEGVYPANYNSPAQTVISYEESALKDLKTALKARKAKAVPLAVAGAFHSPLMQGASEKLAVHLEDLSFGEIKLPMYANVSGLPYENPEDVKEILPMQINSAVLWQKTIEQMISDGFDTFIETGPGKALTGMIGKINKEVATYNVFDDETLKACVSQLR